jgi:hypothetical protein
MAKTRYWVLADDGKTAVPSTLEEWGKWFERADNVVFQTMVGPVQVSTVFLGLDHGFTEGGPPVLWETMILGEEDGEEETWRYTSYDKAIAGHTQIVTEMRERYGGESQ